ncbi:MAG: hypothetical protein J0G35_07580 [Acidobacteriales bacterium]|nr:hypothetical protein [Terriglobales bacterium]
MRTLTRSLTLAAMLVTTGAVFAQTAGIPTGTDPVPPPTVGHNTSAATLSPMLEVSEDIVL